MLDLQPYVCTIQDCSASHRLFSTRAEWFQHEITVHRREWACNWCQGPHTTFSSAEELKWHFVETHPDEVTEFQMPLILEACERPITSFGPSSCPLCTDWEILPPHSTPKAFSCHLARHLQQLAVESIPPSIEGLELRKADDVSEEDDLASGESRAGEVPMSKREPTSGKERQKINAALQALTQEPAEKTKAEVTKVEETSQQKALAEYEKTEHTRRETVEDASQSLLTAKARAESEGRGILAQEQKAEAEEADQQAKFLERVQLEATAKYEAETKAADDQELQAKTSRAEAESKTGEMFEERMRADAELKPQKEASTKAEASLDPFLRFKDALGRKFAFHRDACRRWEVGSLPSQLTNQSIEVPSEASG
jgi:hypothetical protein